VGFAENTVLSAVLTNTQLTKQESNTLARRAQNGLARAVIPTSTSYDGDVIFCLANGTSRIETDVVSELAVEAVRRSIIAAVENAESLGGFKAVRDL
jgi:L-aminopeptidase/D-esterase-like protein